MPALTQDRPTAERDARLVADPLAAGATLYAGGMYMLDAAGAAVPAAPQAAATALVVRAVSRKRTVQAAGDAVSDGARGCFCFESATGADAITRADVGSVCYALDDATVAKGHDSNKRPRAGLVIDVDAGGVWVQIG